MKGKRPSLAGTVKQAAEEPPPSRQGKRRMTVHLDAEMHLELRHLALDLGKSAESVIVAAVAAEMRKHRSSK